MNNLTAKFKHLVDFFESKEEELSFSEEEQLLWPVVGNVLINYSMDKPVYFSTLEQYKYHPAIVIQAKAGQNIMAAARGRVSKIEKTEELGNVITMDIGSGYEIAYGQLSNIQIKEGDLVEKGDYIADVATPTKYYSVEGDSVYFSLKKSSLIFYQLNETAFLLRSQGFKGTTWSAFKGAEEEESPEDETC